MEQILKEYYSVWDIIFILQSDGQKEEVIINKSLPSVKTLSELAAKARYKSSTIPESVLQESFMRWIDVSFLIFLHTIATSVPIPIIVDTMQTFWNIYGIAYRK
jgi:hypothetical protein